MRQTQPWLERNDLPGSVTRTLLRKPRQNEIMPSTADGDSFHPMTRADYHARRPILRLFFSTTISPWQTGTPQ